jgi:hypothetical protein|tara:strand:+ start:255 stop:524 length:270 start_codon:yes stop_codon:yes gene_type:complete
MEEERIESKVAEEPTTQGVKMVGQIRPQRGHTLFKYTVATGKLAPMSKLDPSVTAGPRRVVMAEKGCLYVSALNIKNAIKKITQQLTRD